MKILITNDDGFQHTGHQSLRTMLLEQGHEVWSIAPMQNQSGVGMKLSLGKKLRFQEIDEQSWACSGTPVDCVMFALHGILPSKPDAVISGINAGANLSDDLWYSGTAAAAREASKYGLPALALSYSNYLESYNSKHFALFGSLLQKHLEDLLAACELEAGQGGRQMGFLNINIPEHCNKKLFLASKFEQRGYSNTLARISEDEYTLCGLLDPMLEPSVGVDTWADKNFYASISFSAFQALQPLPYQLAFEDKRVLQATNKAREAMARVLQSGL